MTVVLGASTAHFPEIWRMVKVKSQNDLINIGAFKIKITTVVVPYLGPPAALISDSAWLLLLSLEPLSLESESACETKVLTGQPVKNMNIAPRDFRLKVRNNSCHLFGTSIIYIPTHWFYIRNIFQITRKDTFEHSWGRWAMRFSVTLHLMRAVLLQ